MAPPGSGPYFPADGSVCQKLSDYRLITLDADGNVVPNDGVLPYDINTPLFSDYAKKTRTLFVPPGGSAPYQDQTYFDFPVGTMLTKTFAFPADWRDPNHDVRVIETRVILRLQDGWHARPYVWNADQTEAFYSPLGAVEHVQWIHFDGSTRSTDYVVPDKNQCMDCHGNADPTTHHKVLGLIGPRVKHINKDFDYGAFIPGDVVQNELERWAQNGWLTGVPNDPSTAPAIVPFDQPDPTGATLDARARGYLDANCQHCHNPLGSAESSGLDLNVEETDPYSLGVCQQLQRGITDQVAFDIVPGSPDTSAIYVRMDSLDPAVMMPRLGRSVIHEEGVALIRDWIDWLATPEGIAAYGLNDPRFSCF